MLEFIKQYLSGEKWEKLCNSCYRIRYQEMGYQEIPAQYRGDGLRDLRKMVLYINVIFQKRNIRMINYMNICVIK